MTAGAASAQAYGWRIGALRGIPVYLGRSWPVIAIVVVVAYGPTVPDLSRDGVGRGGVFGYGVAVAYSLLLLLSVLAHEAAHALTARGFGYRVDRIVADLWGGHTVYDSSTSRPGPSAGIAVSGPATNLAIAALGYAAQGLAPSGVVGLLLAALTYSNLYVGVLNLLPGLPLDGGYLVDALVWKVTGDRSKGLIVAGWFGRVLAVGLVFWFVARPLLLGLSPSFFIVIWCAIGAFLWFGASSAIRSGTSRRAIASVSVAQVLRPAVLVRGEESLAVALERVDRGGPAVGRGAGGVLGGGVLHLPVVPLAVVLDPTGRPLGLLDTETARHIDPDRWTQVRADAVTSRQPDGWVVGVTSRDVDVSGMVSALVGRQAEVPRTLLAVSPTGEVLGTVSIEDLNAAFS